MRALLEGLVDLLFPPMCGRCERWLLPHDARDAALCESCRAALPWIPRSRCARCQELAPAPGSAFCAACRRRPSPLASCTAPVRYEAEVEEWIRRFKYPAPGLRGIDPAPLAVVGMLARQAAARAPGPPPDVVVPVPLHPRRVAARGFDPARIAARDVARAIGARFDPKRLRRVRDTPSQTGLDRRARRHNVRDAFEARSTAPSRVWLVDDVVTTGATLEACALVLRRAGARRISALALARTPPPGDLRAGRSPDPTVRLDPSRPRSHPAAAPDRRAS